MSLGGNLSGIVTQGLMGNFQSLILGTFNLGLFELEVGVITPSRGAHLPSFMQVERKPLEPSYIFFDVKFRGHTYKKTYQVTDARAITTARWIRRLSTAKEKASITVSNTTVKPIQRVIKMISTIRKPK